MKRCMSAFAAGIFLSVFPCIAAPACTTALLSTYLNSSTGCSVGEFTFTDFNWSNTGTVAVNPSAVTVTPFANGSRLGLDYTSDAFSVTGEGRIRVLLDYVIDPPPPIIDSFSLRLSAQSPVFPGSAVITVDLCAGDRFTNSCTAGFGTSLTVNDFGISSHPFDSVRFPAPVNLVDVRTTIMLDANGASSQIDGFAQGQQTVVPEPASFALAALGLAFALARPRARLLLPSFKRR